MTDANFNLKKRPFQMKVNKVLRNTSGVLKAKQCDDTVLQSDGESKIQKR